MPLSNSDAHANSDEWASAVHVGHTAGPSGRNLVEDLPTYFPRTKSAVDEQVGNPLKSGRMKEKVDDLTACRPVSLSCPIKCRDGSQCLRSKKVAKGWRQGISTLRREY